MSSVPAYIQDWHSYVEEDTKKHCKDILELKGLVNGLLQNPEVFYDPTDVIAFVDFCKLLKHREGRWVGQPFELTIEQSYFVACVFGFKFWDDEIGMNVRYFREAVLFVARKFGKSLFVSALALFMLMADGEAAGQVWCLATIKAQAGIVYDNAKAFLMSSDVLTPAKNPKKHWRTKRDKDNAEIIMHPATGSYMKAGSKNSEAQDGLNPHAFVIDELHAIKRRSTYDVFSSAGGARAQPLGFIISTFGEVREGIFDGILNRCKQVLQRKSKERIFPMIFRIDDDDDPADRSCWGKANPGIGSRPTMRYLEGEYQKAIEDPAQMPSFLSKHLNRASAMSIIYFDLLTVDKCAIDMNIDMIRDKYAVGGADLAETTDLCCASALIPIGGKLYLFQKYFIAKQRIEKNSKNDKMAYASFCSTKAEDLLNHELMHICEGSMVSRSDVTAWFVMLAQEYGVVFWKLGGDRWHFDDWAEDMGKHGFPVEDSEGNGVLFQVAMGAKTLSKPMKETKALFEDGIIQFSRHNGLFRWCVTNTAAEIDKNGNVQPNKAKSNGRIDGYLSFLFAYVAYMKMVDDFAVYQP